VEYRLIPAVSRTWISGEVRPNREERRPGRDASSGGQSGGGELDKAASAGSVRHNPAYTACSVAGKSFTERTAETA